jgi:uncharacterized membrane protein
MPVAGNEFMESRAKLFGHPVHQMLVTFPIGAFGLSVASDALHTVVGEKKYSQAATLALDFGLASAALAIPFGLIDWLAIPQGTRAKRVGLWHAIGNVAMLGLFGASRWARVREESSLEAKYLSGAAFMLSGVTAWLGGELVDRYGIGVKGLVIEEAPPSFPMSEEAPTLPGIFSPLPRHAPVT